MPGIASAPLTGPQILGRLKTVDGVGSGLEADLGMALRPQLGASLDPHRAGIAIPALNPDAVRSRAILGA